MFQNLRAQPADKILALMAAYRGWFGMGAG